jgi:CxxC-x17-CxxC domain-containing protein
MTVKDKVLQCHDCGTEFTFTVQEQEQFLSVGFTNSPKRRIPCRQKRKERKTGRSQNNVRNTANNKKELFSAVCIECKKETQVPFKPISSKPVYCGMCYYKIRENR